MADTNKPLYSLPVSDELSHDKKEVFMFLCSTSLICSGQPSQRCSHSTSL